MSVFFGGAKDQELTKMWKSGEHTITEIAAHFGTTRQTTDAHARKLLLPPIGVYMNFWTRARTLRMKELYREGKTPREIADLWGVTINVIKGKLSRIRQAERLAGRAQSLPNARGTMRRERSGPRLSKSYYLPPHNTKAFEREMAAERHHEEKKYDDLLGCFADYADDVYEHHGPGPHYESVSTWGGA